MIRFFVFLYFATTCSAQYSDAKYPPQPPRQPQAPHVGERYPTLPPPLPQIRPPVVGNFNPSQTHFYVVPHQNAETTTHKEEIYPTAPVVAVEKPRPVEYNYPERQLPLKDCFYNDHGYACCHKPLQGKMEEVANELLNNGTFHRCNVQRLANKLQEKIEKEFGEDFESVVGLSDFAERVHFRKHYVCKIEVNGRYMLSYSTPEQSKRRLRSKRYRDSEDDEVHEYNF